MCGSRPLARRGRVELQRGEAGALFLLGVGCVYQLDVHRGPAMDWWIVQGLMAYGQHHVPSVQR